MSDIAVLGVDGQQQRAGESLRFSLMSWKPSEIYQTLRIIEKNKLLQHEFCTFIL